MISYLRYHIRYRKTTQNIACQFLYGYEYTVTNQELYSRYLQVLTILWYSIFSYTGLSTSYIHCVVQIVNIQVLRVMSWLLDSYPLVLNNIAYQDYILSTSYIHTYLVLTILLLRLQSHIQGVTVKEQYILEQYLVTKVTLFYVVRITLLTDFNTYPQYPVIRLSL